MVVPARADSEHHEPEAGWGRKLTLSLRFWLRQSKSRLKLQLHRKPWCLNGGNNETSLRILRLTGNSPRPLTRGVAETLVKIPKARGTIIETFMLIKLGFEWFDFTNCMIFIYSIVKGAFRVLWKILLVSRHFQTPTGEFRGRKFPTSPTLVLWCTSNSKVKMFRKFAARPT